MIYYFNLTQYLNLDFIKSQKNLFDEYYQNYPVLCLSAFFGIYVLSVALSLPGATLLTVLAGALFGNLIGIVMVSFASTLGATIAFMVSRYIFRDWVSQRFGSKLANINEELIRNGAFYLFSLRLIPVFPFFLINLLMGLTNIRVITFFWVSQLGMLAGTVVYVNAGTQLGNLQSLSGIVSPEILGSFVMLGLLPWIAKSFISKIQNLRVYSGFKKPKNFDYNVIVIGAGSAGLVSAYIAAAVKAKVLLIEKHKMGGDCLNTGCVPSKALIKSAKVSNLISKSEDFGITTKGIEINFAKVMQRVHKVISEIEPHDSVSRYQGLGVECLMGSAQLISPWQVQVDGKVFSARNIILATGARPRLPKITGMKDSDVLTSDTLWSLTEIPKKLIVVGAGAIGCELAQAFSRLGSQVTIVQDESRIMPKEDPDVSMEVSSHFKHQGINILLSESVSGFKQEGSQKSLSLKSGKSVTADQILFATGRSANTQGFGLEKLGIETTAAGTFKVNEYLQTRFPNIYACGDCVGPYQLTHVASHQAWFCAVNALFGKLKKFKVDYRVIPWCTFTDPEVARVGFSETEALAKNIPFTVTKYDLNDLDRAIADGEAYGFVKVLTAQGSDKILGATIVGSQASSMISEFILAMKYGIGLNKILGTIHIYPTYPEGNKYAAGVWKRSQTKPWIMDLLKRFHQWQK